MDMPEEWNKSGVYACFNKVRSFVPSGSCVAAPADQGVGLVLVSLCPCVCASMLRKDSCCATCARVSARSLPAGVRACWRAQQGDMQYVAMSRKIVVSIENHLQLLGDEDFHTCKVVTWSAAHTHTRALAH
jgi:hypothetical protein